MSGTLAAIEKVAKIQLVNNILKKFGRISVHTFLKLAKKNLGKEAAESIYKALGIIEQRLRQNKCGELKKMLRMMKRGQDMMVKGSMVIVYMILKYPDLLSMIIKTCLSYKVAMSILKKSIGGKVGSIGLKTIQPVIEPVFKTIQSIVADGLETIIPVIRDVISPLFGIFDWSTADITKMNMTLAKQAITQLTNIPEVGQIIAAVLVALYYIVNALLVDFAKRRYIKFEPTDNEQQQQQQQVISVKNELTQANVVNEFNNKIVAISEEEKEQAASEISVDKVEHEINEDERDLKMMGGFGFEDENEISLFDFIIICCLFIVIIAVIVKILKQSESKRKNESTNDNLLLVAKIKAF